MGSIGEAIGVEDEERLVVYSHKKMECNGGRTEAGGKEDMYAEWTARYPSALALFDEMMSVAVGKNVVMFLDYDGTLSPIVDDPDQAFMSESMRMALDRVAEYVPTCIISGRRREKVHEFVQLWNVYYVGSHGLDIEAPDKSLKNGGKWRQFLKKIRIQSMFRKLLEGNHIVMYQPAEEFLPLIEEVSKRLQDKTKDIAGVMIENNKFCVTVHFRRVDEEDWSTLEEQVMEVIEGYSRLCFTRGRKVIEIRPSIEWDKGRALEYLLDTLGFGHLDALPIYIGDDRTDEDAFKVLQSRGRGVPIIVSSIPKETEASYSLCDPSEVMSFLLCLARWIRSSSSGKFCS